MTTIILFGVLDFICGLILFWFIFSLIRKKVKGENINILKYVFKIGGTLTIIGLLIVYQFYLSFSYVKNNSDEILNVSQEVISETVEYGTTAIFEGLGNTIDHFQKKWDDKFVSKIKNIDVLQAKIVNTKIIDNNQNIMIIVTLNNNNTLENTIRFNEIIKNNYALIATNDSVFFPLSTYENQGNNILPTGKTILKLKGIVPIRTEISNFTLLNANYKLSAE